MGKKKGSDKTTNPSKSPVVEFYNGNDTFVLPNGDMYTGDYCAHRSGLIWREGEGTYTTHDGHIYKGHWKDDKLIENSEISISYLDGTSFNGMLTKNKYNGAGSYVLADGLKLVGNFVNNKPVGDVILVDYIGRIWKGQANSNNVIFQPENIFYQNIEEHRGKSKEILKLLRPEVRNTICSEQITGQQADKDMEMTDRDWEKIVFAKSLKVDTHIDFTDCAWYQNFLKYKTERENVFKKIREEGRSALTKEEIIWFKRYLRIKEDWNNMQLQKLAKLNDETVDVSLLETFYSEEYANSFPPINIIYPSYHWKKDEEIEEESMEGAHNLSPPPVTEEELLEEEIVEEVEIEAEEEQEIIYEEGSSILEEELLKKSVTVDTESVINFIQKYYGPEGLKENQNNSHTKKSKPTCIVINSLV